MSDTSTRDRARAERDDLVAQDQRPFVGVQLVANEQRAVQQAAAEQEVRGEQQRDGGNRVRADAARRAGIA